MNSLLNPLRKVSGCEPVETETQRGQVTCLKSHSCPVAELGLDPNAMALYATLFEH